MVLAAERAVLAESQPSATWDSGSGSDPAPMSGHTAHIIAPWPSLDHAHP